MEGKVNELISKDLTEKIMDYGRIKGFSDMEVYYSEGENLTVKIHGEKIDSFNLSQNEGLSFRGLFKDKMGYSYSEKVDDTSIEMLINEALENATIIDSDDKENIFEGGKSYQTIDHFNEALAKVKEEDKIAFALNMEKEALSIDNRIVSVQYCVYGEGYGAVSIHNSKGLYLADKSNVAYAYISVVAKQGEEIKTGMAYRVTDDFSTLNPKEIADEAVSEALAMIGAQSIRSGQYEIVLRNSAVCDLLEAFTGVFSAEAVHKNMSLLKGKLNTPIASESISLVDDPHLPEGFASASFDGEGYPTGKKNIIEKGVLKTYLHNMKTAAIDGIESTGNASRTSYKSSIGISPTNFYIKKGRHSLNELIRDIERGIYIIELQGLHSGLDPVSGDFSLSSLGFLIEKGEIKRAVNQITVSGNFFDMLLEVEMVGEDLKFGLPSGSYIGAPSLKIKRLVVSGE